MKTERIVGFVYDSVLIRGIWFVEYDEGDETPVSGS